MCCCLCGSSTPCFLSVCQSVWPFDSPGPDRSGLGWEAPQSSGEPGTLHRGRQASLVHLKAIGTFPVPFCGTHAKERGPAEPEAVTFPGFTGASVAIARQVPAYGLRGPIRGRYWPASACGACCFPRASLCGQGRSDSELRSGLHFLSSSQTELDSRGAGEPCEAEGFPPPAAPRTPELAGKNEEPRFQRNSPPHPGPIYCHRPFLKKESPRSIPTSCAHGEEGAVPPSGGRGRAGPRKPRPAADQGCRRALGLWGCFPIPDVRPGAVRFRPGKCDSCSSPLLLGTLLLRTPLVLSLLPVKLLTWTCTFCSCVCEIC